MNVSFNFLSLINVCCCVPGLVLPDPSSSSLARFNTTTYAVAQCEVSTKLLEYVLQPLQQSLMCSEWHFLLAIKLFLILFPERGLKSWYKHIGKKQFSWKVRLQVYVSYKVICIRIKITNKIFYTVNYDTRTAKCKKHLYSPHSGEDRKHDWCPRSVPF